MRRRRLKRLVRWVAAAVVVACAAAWVVGRVFSDRYAWSQPIAWIPAPALAVPIWMALVGVATWEQGRRAVVRKREPGASVRAVLSPAAGMGLLGMTVVTAWHLAFVEMGLQRAVAGGSSVASEPVRIIFWNQAGADVGDVSPAFMGLDPGIFALANRHSSTRTREIAQAFIDSGEAYAAVGWPFDLFARYPVRRWGSASLGLKVRSRNPDGPQREDPGWAAFYQLDTPGGLLTIWMVDLPSDPREHRLPLARAAGAAIAGWRGAVRVVDPERGQWTERSDATGFPAPDVIVGDFNIPRRSASLRAFLLAAGAGGHRHAFDEAGWGWDGTWPRAWPVWAIDQCFLGPRVEAVWFEAVDPGMGGHRAISVDLVWR